MSKDKTAVPTGMALTHLDPVFRERPDEYLDVMRSREPRLLAYIGGGGNYNQQCDALAANGYQGFAMT